MRLTVFLALAACFSIAAIRIPAVRGQAASPPDDIDLSLSPSGPVVTVEHLAVPPSPTVPFRVRALSIATGAPLIGLAVEVQIVTSTSTSPVESSADGLVNGYGRTDELGFLNLTQLAMVSCGVHRLIARAVAHPNVTTADAPQDTWIRVARRPASCSGVLFDQAPSRSTPLDTPLRFVVPRAVRDDVREAMLSQHPDYAVDDDQFEIRAGQPRNSWSNSLSRSVTAELFSLSATRWRRAAFLTDLPTMFAVVVDSCGEVLPNATVIPAIASIAVAPSLSRGEVPGASSSRIYDPAFDGRWQQRTVVPRRSAILNGPQRFVTELNTSDAPVPTVRVEGLSLAIFSVSTLTMTFHLPTSDALSASDADFDPDSTSVPQLTSCDSFALTVQEVFPPPEPQNVTVTLSIGRNRAAQTAPAAATSGIELRNEDLAVADTVFVFEFDHDVLPGVETLVGHVRFSSDVSQTEAPRAILYVIGDQDGTEFRDRDFTVPANDELNAPADAVQQLAVMRVGRTLYFPKRRVPSGDGIKIMYEVHLLRADNAFTLRSETLTVQLNPELQTSTTRFTQTRWSIPIVPRNDPQGTARAVLAYIALFGRQLDLGSIAATMHVADCSKDQGLQISPAIYPFAFRFDDSVYGFWKGAVVLNLCLMVLCAGSEALVNKATGSGSLGSFPHFTLVVARMFHAATSLAAFVLIPHVMDEPFGYYVLAVVVFFCILYPFVSAAVLRIAKVPWDRNELMRAYENLDELERAVIVSEEAMHMRERRRRKLARMRRELNRRRALGDTDTATISTNWKEQVKRFFRKRGTYSILCADHERARSVFERYRGEARYWGTIDMLFYLVLGSVVMVPCPLRSTVALIMVSIHLAMLLIVNPYISVALNVGHEVMDVALVAGAALLTRQEERAAQPLLDTAFYVAVFVNICWLVVSFLSSPSITVAITRLYDYCLERKKTRGDISDRTLVVLTVITRRLLSIQHSRSLDDDYCARSIQHVLERERERRELEIELLADSVEWPADCHPDLLIADELNDGKLHTAKVDISRAATKAAAADAAAGDASQTPTATFDDNASGTTRGSPSPAAVLEVPSPKASAGSPEARDPLEELQAPQASVIVPSVAAADANASLQADIDQFLADAMRGAAPNPIEEAGYSASSPRQGSSSPRPADGPGSPSRAGMGRSVSFAPSASPQPEDPLIDESTGLRHERDSFLPHSAHVAFKKQQRLATEVDERELAYQRAHFELFSGGKSLDRMQREDATTNPWTRKKRNFAYFPATMTSEEGAAKVERQGRFYCPPHRRRNQFVARVRVSQDGVEPVYKKREKLWSDVQAEGNDSSGSSGVDVEQLTVLERKEFQRANTVRPWTGDAAAAAAPQDEVPHDGDSDHSIERHMSWKQGDEWTEEERKYVKLKNRAGAGARTVRLVTVADREYEAEYRRRHFDSFNGGLSDVIARQRFDHAAPARPNRAQSRTHFFAQRDAEERRNRRRATGAEVSSTSSEEDMDELMARIPTWEKRAKEKLRRKEEREAAKLPQLRRGRNIVAEQLALRRRNAQLMEAAGISRESAEYQML